MPQDLISYLSQNSWADSRAHAQSTPALQPGSGQQRTEFADQLKRRQEPEEASRTRTTTRETAPRRTPEAAKTTEPNRNGREKSAATERVNQTQPTESRDNVPAARTIEEAKPTSIEPLKNETDSPEPVEAVAADDSSSETAAVNQDVEAVAVETFRGAEQQTAVRQTSDFSEEVPAGPAVTASQDTSDSAVAPRALSRHWGNREQSTVQEATPAEKSTATATEESTPVAPSAFSRSLRRPLRAETKLPNNEIPTEAPETVTAQESTEVIATAPQPAAVPQTQNDLTLDVDASSGTEAEGEASIESADGDASGFAPMPFNHSGQHSNRGGIPIGLEATVAHDLQTGRNGGEPLSVTTAVDSATVATAPNIAQVQPDSPVRAEQNDRSSSARSEPFAAPLEAVTKSAGDKTTKAATTPTLDVNKPGFEEKLTSYMQSAAETGKSLRIRLNPRELGLLQIEVQQIDGQTTARLEVETPAAKSIVMEQLHMLRDSLQQQGIRLDQLEVELNENMSQNPEGDQSPGHGQHHESEQEENSGSQGSETAESNTSSEREANKETRRVNRRANEQIDVAI